MLELIIKREKDERKIALVENEKIIEYYEEKEDDNRNEGNIYIGVVKDIVKGMQAEFINIGKEKNSLIHLKDILEKKDEKKEKEKNKTDQKIEKIIIHIMNMMIIFQEDI